MTTILQFGNRIITASEIIPLLASYQLLPRLSLELIIDEAIASVECTPEEIASNYQLFCQKNQLTCETQHQVWLSCYGMNTQQLEALATRNLKIEKFKQANWGDKVESYFHQRKSQLDQVIYSVIRHQDTALTQELYFRLLEKEESFSELAQKYSQGPEVQTGGLVGPIELNECHPGLAKILRASQPGQLWTPMRMGKWVMIVRLEKWIPAQLDELTRRRLLNELFTNWLQQQLNPSVSSPHIKDVED
jgi:parvulin-like peptidyl-prolyl isomerase